MIRHRRAVLAAWLVVFVVSGAAASGLSDKLTNRFHAAGTDTARAERILEDHFGRRRPARSPSSPARRRAARRSCCRRYVAAAERAAGELPTSRVASVQPVSDAVVAATITSNLEPAGREGPHRRHAGGRRHGPGAELFVSGQAAIEHDLDPVFAEDLKVGELYIAIPIALLILIFVFGTLAFVVPMLFAAFTIPATLGIIGSSRASWS